ncbi:MAG: hypothetical protein H6545_05930 [Bacteroidales bacterium]|nr:hypothetical protein [Bacteroidales bacterium]
MRLSAPGCSTSASCHQHSIARTVALPAAMAVKMILTGKILLHGVYRPILPEIYNPILDELEANGIRMEEEYGLPVDMMIK